MRPWPYQNDTVKTNVFTVQAKIIERKYDRRKKQINKEKRWKWEKTR